MPAPPTRNRLSSYRRSWTTLTAAWLFTVGMLTVFPVRVVEVDRRLAGRAMALAPLVGLVLGFAAAMVLVGIGWAGGSPLLAAVLAVGTLAWLTRGLHLDGLADLADGLGSGKPPEQALAIMKRSDIGPFGVVTLVLTLLMQVAALTALAESPLFEPSQTRASPTGAALAGAALVAACMTGRLAITWACRRGVPTARPGGLGALVAQTVRPGRALVSTLFSAGAVVLFTIIAVISSSGFPRYTTLPAYTVAVPFGPLLAMAVGLGAAELLRRRAVRRLGGVTGDVLGALCECATTVTLLCCALVFGD